MRIPNGAVVLLFSMIISAGCATAPPQRASTQDACADPMYVRLKAIHPDSLSEREFVRLRDLEAICRAQPQTADHRNASGEMMGGARRWLWMPVMMVAAGMGLMMGWWW